MFAKLSNDATERLIRIHGLKLIGLAYVCFAAAGVVILGLSRYSAWWQCALVPLMWFFYRSGAVGGYELVFGQPPEEIGNNRIAHKFRIYFGVLAILCLVGLPVGIAFLYGFLKGTLPR
jgi:hypothetical protein